MHFDDRSTWHRRSIAYAVSLGLLAACASAPNEGPPASPTAATGGGGQTSSTIITAADLAAMNRPLIDILRQRFPGMHVAQSPSGCPDIALRGKSTVTTSSAPLIYVDGNPSSNTCILQELRTVDIDQVEIYPGGIAPRGGYRSHPYGLILIFLKRV